MNSDTPEKFPEKPVMPSATDKMPAFAQLPPALHEMIGKTPMGICKLFGVKEKERDGLAALMFGIGIDLDIPVPEWAKAAACKLLEAVGLTAQPTSAAEFLDRLGRLIGLLEIRCSEKDDRIDPANAEQMAIAACQLARRTVANAAPDQSSQFFQGRANARETLERIQSLPQRTKVYRAIATDWPTVSKFQSVMQLHSWLVAGKMIQPQTDSADTRKVCRLIGLKFPSKPGRPAKKSGH